MPKKNFFIKKPAIITPPVAPVKEEPSRAHLFKDGNPGGPGGKPGMTLLTRVKQMLCETSRKNDGRYNTRFDDAADAFAAKMEDGSFIHTKEYIDREEGKVPQRLAGADGKDLKGYIGMPMEGPDAP